MTKRRAVLAKLLDLVGAISLENGYETDAGQTVTLGEAPSLGEGDPDVAIAIVVADTIPQQVGGYIQEVIEVEIQAVAKADLDEPYVAAEVVLGDIVKAMEQPDRTLGSLLKGELRGGRIRTLPRDPGATVVGVGATYEMFYVRKWGEP